MVEFSSKEQKKKRKKRLDSSILASLLQYLHVSEIVEIPHIVHVGTIENIFYIKNELYIPVVSSKLFFHKNILSFFPIFQHTPFEAFTV